RDNGFYFNAIRRLPYAALKVPEVPSPITPAPLSATALTEYVGRYVFGGSSSSLDRQILVADGIGWTGLECVVAETGGLRVIKPVDAGHAGRSHHGDRRHVDEGPDAGSGAWPDCRSGQHDHQVQNRQAGAERSAVCR